MVERVGAKASAPDARRTAPRATFAMEAAISREVKVVVVDFQKTLRRS